MNNNIPTAEEFIRERYKGVDYNKGETFISNIEDDLIEFAKLHVKAALEAAAENADCEDTYIGDGEHESWSVDKKSILNAYPLDNIK